ncbi:SCP2 domain-containing protein [Undibacterium sp.]|uniref:ubiquinone anaerobic biosynthesis accessory factor UbiT n=1 Tax=Undibacterium sp. TaxID=1914977 RepID=UPI0037529148
MANDTNSGNLNAPMMNFNDFRFPQVFGKIGQRLPSPVASAPLMLMLALARQRSWLIAPENLYGKTFQIYVEDLGLRLCFRCDHGHFKAIQHQTTDVSLSACAMDFLKLATALEDADTLFFRRRLKIEGNTELGIGVKYWIDASERPAWLNLLAEKLSSSSNTGSL